MRLVFSSNRPGRLSTNDWLQQQSSVSVKKFEFRKYYFGTTLKLVAFSFSSANLLSLLSSNSICSLSELTSAVSSLTDSPKTTKAISCRFAEKRYAASVPGLANRICEDFETFCRTLSLSLANHFEVYKTFHCNSSQLEWFHRKISKNEVLPPQDFSPLLFSLN